MNKKYSQQQEAFIQSKAKTLNDNQLTIEFNATFGTNLKVYSVSQKRRRLKIKKMRGRGKCELVKTKSTKNSVVSTDTIVHIKDEGAATEQQTTNSVFD